jgi:hypothetical protein
MNHRTPFRAEGACRKCNIAFFKFDEKMASGSDLLTLLTPHCGIIYSKLNQNRNFRTKTYSGVVGSEKTEREIDAAGRDIVIRPAILTPQESVRDHAVF